MSEQDERNTAAAVNAYYGVIDALSRHDKETRELANTCVTVKEEIRRKSDFYGLETFDFATQARAELDRAYAQYERV